ncbi:MAG: hypothetical protein K8R69_05750, partial [Deltaproteobacteria bacterium]|nr:hypothetical protein [Deltaproteobacteria bacterium]
MAQREGKEAYERGLQQGSVDRYVGFELQKYLLQLILHPLRTWRHFLSRPSGRLFLFYAGLNFILGFAGASGFFASNALLLGAGGPQAMRPAYAVSATGSIVLAGLIYLIASKIDYRKLLRNSLFALACIGLVFGLGLGPHPENLALTFSLRIFMFIAIFWIHLLFWNAVGSLFSNLESKRYFPLFIVAEILGEVMGSLGLEFGSRVLPAHAYCFVFSTLVVFGAAAFRFHPRFEKNIGKTSAEVDSLKESSFWNRGSWILASTAFSFWCAYSFISSGMDLIFNQIALENFGSGNSLTAYLGAIAFFGNSAVLLYQTFFSESLSLRFGVTRSLTAISWAGSACLALFLIHPNLRTAELSQQTLFFFVDFAAIALFSSMMSLVPASQRSRWLALTEGIGRPLGCFLLLALPVGGNLTDTLAVYRIPLFAGLLFMAAIPIPFAWIYRRHLREHLSSSDQDLKKNVV